jgi:hypothetical protein
MEGDMAVHTFISIICALIVMPSGIWAAIDCKPLVPSQRVNKEIEAKLEVDTSKLVQRLVGGGEVSYRQLTQDTLKDYPEADRLVICERLIYLSCTILENSKEPFTKQIEVVDGLMRSCKAYRLDVVRSDKKPNYSKTVEGFRFDLHSCSLTSGRDVCCDLNITSEGKDRFLGIGYSPQHKLNISRAFDDTGQVYQASNIELGEFHGKPYILNELPADLPMVSKLCFANISTKAIQFQRLEINFLNAEKNNAIQRVVFSAVPLPRE